MGSVSQGLSAPLCRQDGEEPFPKPHTGLSASNLRDSQHLFPSQGLRLPMDLGWVPVGLGPHPGQ